MNKKKLTVIIIVAVVLILVAVFSALYCTGALSGFVDMRKAFAIKR